MDIKRLPKYSYDVFPKGAIKTASQCGKLLYTIEVPNTPFLNDIVKLNNVREIAVHRDCDGVYGYCETSSYVFESVVKYYRKHDLQTLGEL